MENGCSNNLCEKLQYGVHVKPGCHGTRERGYTTEHMGELNEPTPTVSWNLTPTLQFKTAAFTQAWSFHCQRVTRRAGFSD